MKKITLTLLAAALLAGCSQPPAPQTTQAPTPRHRAVEPEAPRPTIVTIEYGNSASKASLQVDVANTDIFLDMSNTRARIDTGKIADSQGSKFAMSQNTASRNVTIDSSVREDNRKIVDAAVRPANGDSDGATLKVTSAIRKAQDAFYKGSYEEAQILTRKSIEARPTPEAHALAGSIAWTLKDFPLARFHWKQALSLDPDFPGVSDMLIRLPQETVR
ncbi:MAG: hypothetical protein RL318_469 [Fibrobacterota bacterium]|jgi:tetratricopeptide (TPR) repeat protein